MRYTPLLFSAAIAAPSAYADIQFNGFLSAIGGAATDEPIRQYEKDATFKKDSLFGLQARADLSDKLSVTGQLVSRGQQDFSTELAWGYLAYEANQSLTLRMGRFRTPFYFYSDFLEVGYAYPWVSPPDEVYALQFDNIDGIDILYKTTLFNILNTELQTYFGAIDDQFIINNTGERLDARTRNNIGLSATFGIGDVSLRLSAHNAKTSVDTSNVFGGEGLAGLQTALRNLGQAFDQAELTNKIADNLVIDESNTTYTQAGLKYDGERFFAVAEATLLEFDEGPTSEQKHYFVSGGINFGPATVFASYAESDDRQSDLTSELTALNANIGNADLAQLIGGIAMIEGSDTLNETISFGVRYDFEPGAAFKIQYDNIDTPDASDPTKMQSHGLVRFGVDLVF